MSDTDKLNADAAALLKRKLIPMPVKGGMAYLFWCPACKYHHSFHVMDDPNSRPSWTFDGNMDHPTFAPSLLLYEQNAPGGPRKTLCHLFLQAGNLVYCSDCPHEFRDRIEPLRPEPEGLNDEREEKPKSEAK